MPHSSLTSPELSTKLSPARLYLWIGTTSLPPGAASNASRAHPFLWSCVTENPQGLTEQIGFLDTEGVVPARAFVDTLLDALAAEGDIVVSTSTAQAIRNDLITAFPELGPRFDQIVQRLIEVKPAFGVGSHEVQERALLGPGGVGLAAGVDLVIGAEVEVTDAQDVQDAYWLLIDVDRPASERRAIAWALFRYADRQTASLIREFARGATGDQGGAYGSS
jgi:hypothetical protein